MPSRSTTSCNVLPGDEAMTPVSCSQLVMAVPSTAVMTSPAFRPAFTAALASAPAAQSPVLGSGFVHATTTATFVLAPGSSIRFPPIASPANVRNTARMKCIVEPATSTTKRCFAGYV